MLSPNLSFQDFGENIQGSWKHLNQCNILVVGNTGAGKTTLISNVLNTCDSRKQVVIFAISLFVQSGLHRPALLLLKDYLIAYQNRITKDIKAYQSGELTNLTLYDTKGFEREKRRFLNIWQEKNSQQTISDFIDKQKTENKEPEDHIHIVWYCFSAQTNRVSEIDTDFIHKISAKQIPIILVRTRSYDTDTKNDLFLPIAELESNLPVKELVLVIAEAEQIRRGETIEAFGLDILQEVTEECLNDIAEKAFLDAVKAKKDKAISSLTFPLIAIAVEQGLIPPIPMVKLSVIGSSQAFIAKRIANIFGYQAKFSDEDVKHYIAIASIAEILSLDSTWLEFKDYLASSLPNINENTGVVEALHILSSLISNGVGEVKTIPFQEELGKVVGNIAKFLEKDSVALLSRRISFLTIFTSLTSALIMVITTLIFALIWIETLEKMKIKKYQGEDIPAEQVQEIIQVNIDKIRRKFIRLNPAVQST